MRFVLRSRFASSLSHTVTSHGWVKLAPWHCDTNNAELSRTELLAIGKVATVKVSQLTPRSFLVQVNGCELKDPELRSIERRVQRWLSFEWNPGFAINIAEKVDPRVANLIREGGGRFLRCSTFYEDFAKTICTINTNWTSTIRMVSSLVADLGRGVFPTPEMVVECGEEFLRKNIRLGFRSKVLARASSQLLDQGILDGTGNLRAAVTYEELLDLRGIGPYSAGHLMMLEHDFSRVPVDSEVSYYCEAQYGIGANQVQSYFDRWDEYRFLGYKLSRILSQANWIG